MYERFRACENDNLYFTSSVTIDIAGTTHAVYATRQAIARNDFGSSFWQTFISLWFNLMLVLIIHQFCRKCCAFCSVF